MPILIIFAEFQEDRKWRKIYLQAEGITLYQVHDEMEIGWFITSEKIVFFSQLE